MLIALKRLTERRAGAQRRITGDMSYDDGDWKRNKRTTEVVVPVVQWSGPVRHPVDLPDDVWSASDDQAWQSESILQRFPPQPLSYTSRYTLHGHRSYGRRVWDSTAVGLTDNVVFSMMLALRRQKINRQTACLDSWLSRDEK